MHFRKAQNDAEEDILRQFGAVAVEDDNRNLLFEKTRMKTVHQNTNEEVQDQANSSEKSNVRESTSSDALLSGIKQVVEMQVQSRLPAPCPDVFAGDRLRFVDWLQTFETIIELEIP